MERTFFILLFFIIFLSPGKAQDIKFSSLSLEDYYSLELPSLNTLFENARKSAAVEYYRLRLKEQETMLKTEKRSWMNYFRASGSYSYGKSGVLSYSEDNLSLYQYSDVEQNYYSIGASVSIPLDDLFDRPNRVKRQKFQMEATQVEVERWLDEQKLKIIDYYINVEQSFAVLKIKIETLNLANAQYNLAESNFINGKIDALQLSQQKSVQLSAFTDYEQTKAILNKGILQLEVLTKTKIISK